MFTVEGKFIIAGKTRWQESEADGHVASKVLGNGVIDAHT